MKVRLKKALSLLLAFVMSLGCMSLSAFADTTPVAEVNGTQYATLKEAIDAAASGDTVTLLQNVTLSSTLELSKSITLDLNEKTLSKTLASTSDKTPVIKALSGTVLITNGAITYNISTYTGNGATSNANVINVGMNMSNGIYSGGECVLTLNGVDVSVDFPKGKVLSMIYVESGKLNVVDSNLSATNVLGNTSAQYLIYTVANVSTVVNPYVTISGSTTLDTNSSAGIHAIWLQNANDTLYILGNDVTILADATWKPNSYSTSYAYAVNNQSGATCTIEGGKFSGKVWQTKGTIDVSGGYFSYAQGTTGQKNKITLAEGVKYLDNTDPATSAAYPYVVAPLKTNVAQIGETQYETLADAIAAANDGTETTITMIGDSAEPNVITVAAGQNIVLDLAGYTVSHNSALKSVSFITNKGTLTIQDTGSNGKITMTAVADTGYSVQNITVYNLGGTLNLNSGIIENLTNGGLTYAVNNSSNAWGVGDDKNTVFNMTGGRLSGNGTDNTLRVYQNCADTANPVSHNTVTISGGEIDNGIFIDTFLHESSTNPDYSGISTHINITGGTINGLIDLKIRHKYDTVLNISGGDFTNATLRVRKPTSEYKGEEPTEPMVNISGGSFTFDSESFVTNDFATYSKPYSLTGGTFNVDPTETGYVADGYTANANGNNTWTVAAAKTYVAQIGDKKYETLAAAIAAAKNGETVKLLAPVVETNFQIRESFTLDLNDQTITGGGSSSVLNISPGATLTVTDSGQNGTGKIVSTYSEDGACLVCGALIWNGGTLINNEGNPFGGFPDYTEVIAIHGGSIETTKPLVTGLFCTVNLTVDGGSLKAPSLKGPGMGGFSFTLNATLTGGTFNVNPNAAYVADGYEAKQITSGEYAGWYEVVPVVNNVAEIYTGETLVDSYTKLKDALDAANVIGESGTPVTVKLLCDYDLEANEPGLGYGDAYPDLSGVMRQDWNNTLHISDNVSFDLNGNTLSNLYNNAVYVTGKDVTIKNGEMRVGNLYKDGDNTKTCSYVIRVKGAKNLVIDDLTTFGGINVSASTATINNLSFSGTTFYAVCSQVGSTVTLNGGTYNKAIAGSANYLFWVESGSTMNITGGTYTKGTAKFISNSSARPVITGGVFDFDPTNNGVASGYEAKQIGKLDQWAVGQTATTLEENTVVTATSAEKANEAVQSTSATTNVVKYDGNTGEETEKTAVVATKKDDGTYTLTATTTTTSGDESPTVQTVNNITVSAARSETTINEGVEYDRDLEYSLKGHTNTISLDKVDVNQVLSSLGAKAKAADNTVSVENFKSVVISLRNEVQLYDLDTKEVEYKLTPYAVASTEESTTIITSDLTESELIGAEFPVEVPVSFTGRAIVYYGETALDAVAVSDGVVQFTASQFTESFRIVPLSFDGQAAVLGANIELNGTLDLNFYVGNPPEGATEVVMWLPERGTSLTEVTVNIADARVYGEEGPYYGCYVFTFPVPAQNKDSSVKLKFVNEHGDSVPFMNDGTTSFSFSVREYLEKLKDETGYSSKTELVNVVEKLETYSNYAKTYLTNLHVNNGYSWTYSASYKDEAVNAMLDTLNSAGYKPTGTRGSGSNPFSEVALELTSGTNLRLICNNNGAQSYTYKVDGVDTELVSVEDGNGYDAKAVVISNIAANQLNKLHTIQAYNGDELVYTMRYNALGYARSVLKRYIDAEYWFNNNLDYDKLNAVAALYEYNQAAIQYLGTD